MLLQEHSSCLYRSDNGKPFCLAELWPALIVWIRWDFTIYAVHEFQNTKKKKKKLVLKFISAPRKDKHFIGQLWQLMIESNVGAWTQAWQASRWFSKSTALSARVSLLSPQPLPALLLAPFFIVLFDSCSSFFAPKQHRNACYPGCPTVSLLEYWNHKEGRVGCVHQNIFTRKVTDIAFTSDFCNTVFTRISAAVLI